MRKLLKVTVLLLLVAGCKQSIDNKSSDKKISGNDNPTRVYSKSVNDTFTVSVSLPYNYEKDKSKKYPIVYLLDANLYFDIAATTFKKYAEVGLLPSVILVGIGYSDFETMDSLRQRDLTYPVAIPEYEMSVSGGADKFLSFLSNELIPEMDKNYFADKNKRILMGHSLGGYFTLYSFLQNTNSKNNIFSSYIAASPSTHYNHNYILNELGKLKQENKDDSKIYVTFGGSEDTEDEEDSTITLGTNEILMSLKKSLNDNYKTDYKGESYSNLGHMDTGLPTFIKGLQWILKTEE